MATFKSRKGEVQEELDKKVVAALEACGLIAEGYAKTAITQQQAVDTGLLRNSITYAISGNAPAISSYKADRPKGNRPASGEYSGTADSTDKPTLYLGTNVEYAPYIELGTGKHTSGGRQSAFAGGHGMPARPYLKPALADHAAEYQKALIEYLKN